MMITQETKKQIVVSAIGAASQFSRSMIEKFGSQFSEIATRVINKYDVKEHEPAEQQQVSGMLCLVFRDALIHTTAGLICDMLQPTPEGEEELTQIFKQKLIDLRKPSGLEPTI